MPANREEHKLVMHFTQLAPGGPILGKKPLGRGPGGVLPWWMRVWEIGLRPEPSKLP
jgi:hypothetical protein